MTDALQLVEGRVRQRPTFLANLQPPIRKVIDLYHFAAKADCQAFRLKRQLHATVVHHQLVRHLTLLTPTQNLTEILPGIDRTVKVLIAGRGLGKAAVVVGDEAGQKPVCLGRTTFGWASASRAKNMSVALMLFDRRPLLLNF